MGKRFIIATGGTGGHIFPALSLEEALRKEGHECLVIADKRFLNFKAKIPKILKYKIIPTGTLSRISGIFQVILGVYFAVFHIMVYRPQVIISFGGYPSFPTMAAAILLRKPLMIHEQNSVIGKAHRAVMRWADIISVPFDSVKGLEKADRNKVHVVGNPVDPLISDIGRKKYPKIKDKDDFNILILGGSQGAKVLSKIVPEAIKRMKPLIKSRLSIVQQCRDEDLECVKKVYSGIKVKAEASGFFLDIDKRIAKANLIICRAGASTVSELIASGRPSILIPISISNHNHQLLNAKILEGNKGGWIIEEKDFSAKKLSEKLTYLLSKPDVLSKASTNARSLFIDSNKNMLELIERYCAEHDL
jgi:UDP-N-acetylglucosamine--N-acetylmuramyl-(pentapeptide) pyrophosphoryl-undecaprenol N-acetylglucosamine transferase